MEGWPPSKNRAITLYMQGIGFVQEILNLLLNYIYILCMYDDMSYHLFEDCPAFLKI